MSCSTRKAVLGLGDQHAGEERAEHERQARQGGSPASSSVTAGLSARTASSERRRATMPSLRASAGAPATTRPSATAALTSAAPIAMPIASADCPSAGSRMSSGTTARSWNSSTPITCRPCGAASSRRLGEQLRDDRGGGHRHGSREGETGLPGGAQPERAAHRERYRAEDLREAQAEHTRRMEISFGRLNSRPMENIRKQHAHSASTRISPRSETRPKTCGPSAGR